MVFNHEDNAIEVLQRARHKTTTLIGFLATCARDANAQ